MPFTTSRTLPLSFVAVFLMMTGCHQTVPAGPSEFTFVSAAAQDTIYEAEMAFNVELLDPATGLYRHATMAELKPAVMREVHRLKQEPLLRQVLNKLPVQQTEWFKSFDANLNHALAALLDATAVHHIPDTPLIRVSITMARRDDAQTILAALGEEYMRMKTIHVNAAATQRLRAAHENRDRAEQQYVKIQVAIKRFLENNPIDTLDEQTSEPAMQVHDLSQSLNELKRQHATASANRDQYRKRLKEGDFNPSDTERVKVNQSAFLQEIDHLLLDLHHKEAALQSEEKPDAVKIKHVETHILALERQRQTVFDRQAREWFNASHEQATMEAEFLKTHLESTAQSLAEWTIKRQDQFQVTHEYSTLLRGLRSAEADRHRATQKINDLMTQLDEGGAGRLGYRVLMEYPAQRSRKRADQ